MKFWIFKQILHILKMMSLHTEVANLVHDDLSLSRLDSMTLNSEIKMKSTSYGGVQFYLAEWWAHTFVDIID
jgi:hypothetical protein